jgi:hypothetical protein
MKLGLSMCMSVGIYERGRFSFTQFQGVWSTSHPGRHSSWKCPSVTLKSRLGGLQHKSGGFGEEINLLSMRGIVPRFLGRLACSLVAVPCVLSPFNVKMKYIQSELNCGYLTWLPNLIWDPGQEVLLRLDRTSCHKQHRFMFVQWAWLFGNRLSRQTFLDSSQSI